MPISSFGYKKGPDRRNFPPTKKSAKLVQCLFGVEGKVVPASIGGAAGMKIVHFMPLHMLSRARQPAVISVAHIKAVVNLPVKVFRPVKPRSGPSEDSMRKPFWPEIAVRSTIIRGIVVIPVRTHRRRPNLHCYLSMGIGQ